MTEDDYPIRKKRARIEVERLMLDHFNGNNYDYCRWLLRYNKEINARPFDLYEESRDLEVLALAKAIVKHTKFLDKIEKDSSLP